jgi:hypothetical protein
VLKELEESTPFAVMGYRVLVHFTPAQPMPVVSFSVEDPTRGAYVIANETDFAKVLMVGHHALHAKRGPLSGWTLGLIVHVP